MGDEVLSVHQQEGTLLGLRSLQQHTRSKSSFIHRSLSSSINKPLIGVSECSRICKRKSSLGDFFLTLPSGFLDFIVVIGLGFLLLDVRHKFLITLSVTSRTFPPAALCPTSMIFQRCFVAHVIAFRGHIERFLAHCGEKRLTCHVCFNVRSRRGQSHWPFWIVQHMLWRSLNRIERATAYLALFSMFDSSFLLLVNTTSLSLCYRSHFRFSMHNCFRWLNYRLTYLRKRSVV